MTPLHIFEHCGLKVTQCIAVHGGDINQCYRVDTADRRYFLKINNAGMYPLMLEKEASGLTALAKGSSLTVPEVIRSGTCGNDQYLLLEWLESSVASQKAWEAFGSLLADMHQRTQRANAGWEEDNYIGSLVQVNDTIDRWSSFYTECRIRPLIQKLYDAGYYSKSELDATEKFCKNVETIFPEEPMSLLHGDLWSGNRMFIDNETVAIFDPAIYYGHREMDIGMTRLFGGFGEEFYHAYEARYPLEQHWERRLPLTQLYPILVHAVLFGGHYVQSAVRIIRSFA